MVLRCYTVPIGDFMISESEAITIFNSLQSAQIEAKTNNSNKSKQTLINQEKIVYDKFEYIISSKTYRYKQFHNYEDIRQEAFDALFKALLTYKEKKGSIFWWINKYVDTRVKRVANKHAVIRVPIVAASTQPPMQEQITSKIMKERFNAQESAEEMYTNQQLIKNITKACEKLPKQNVDMLFDYFGLNENFSPKTVAQISEETHIPKNVVQKTINTSIKELKNLCQI